MSENDRPWKRDVEKAQHLQAKRGGYRAIADEGHHLYVEGRPCDAGDLGTSRLANTEEDRKRYESEMEKKYAEEEGMSRPCVKHLGLICQQYNTLGS
jgi:hypothetical protein